MDDFEPSVQSLQSPVIISKDLGDRVLRGDDELLVSGDQCSALSLKDTAVSISPYLELLPKTFVFWTKVVHNDPGLALVAIPPLVAKFGIESLAFSELSSCSALADS